MSSLHGWSEACRLQKENKGTNGKCHVRALVFSNSHFLIATHSDDYTPFPVVDTIQLAVLDSEQNSPMLWATKRRKSRPDIHPKSPPQTQVRRSSLGSTRLPFAPLDPHQETDMPEPQNIYGRSILTLDEQQRLARQNSPSVASSCSLFFFFLIWQPQIAATQLFSTA
jgi:hypothetical protein